MVDHPPDVDLMAEHSSFVRSDERECDEHWNSPGAIANCGERFDHLSHDAHVRGALMVPAILKASHP